VNGLIEGGALSAAELGKIVIQREQENAVAAETSTAESAEQQGSVARET
jgi:hypothetical protein